MQKVNKIFLIYIIVFVIFLGWEIFITPTKPNFQADNIIASVSELNESNNKELYPEIISILKTGQRHRQILGIGIGSTLLVLSIIGYKNTRNENSPKS